MPMVSPTRVQMASSLAAYISLVFITLSPRVKSL